MANDPTLFELTADNGFSFSTSALRDGVHFSAGANFNRIGIMGRSSDIITFANGANPELNVNLELIALEPSAKERISGVIKSFYSLRLPMKPGIKPPPKCKVTAGNILEDWECVVANVDFQWGNQNIWDSDGSPMTAIVNLNLLGIEIENVSSEEWLDTRNFRLLSFEGNSQ